MDIAPLEFYHPNPSSSQPFLPVASVPRKAKQFLSTSINTVINEGEESHLSQVGGTFCILKLILPSPLSFTPAFAEVRILISRWVYAMSSWSRMQQDSLSQTTTNCKQVLILNPPGYSSPDSDLRIRVETLRTPN
eukprot:TRINITY_DN3195_c0_g2_i1.p2 TRINITY_DN3195_c0_g2~~TRINITY_DN3195_c0_g2_i1.p2  ORF type:complete len:135 (-),score=13.93 TRINITY_DN3195_c0_g2_i1:397-801(-)